jgi:hypothetical protein
VTSTSVGAASAGGVLLTLLPDAESISLLKSTGSATVSAALDYLPQGGGASGAQSLTTTLQLNLSKKKCKKGQRLKKGKCVKKKGKKKRKKRRGKRP